MEGLLARARLVDLADDSTPPALTTTIPRHEIEEALAGEDGPMDLVLDVARYSGEGETTTAVKDRIAISWDETDLEDLLRRAEGDSITLAFDGEALLGVLDAEVEGHGLREVSAVLAVTVTAGIGAGAASAAYPDPMGSGGSAIEQGYNAIEQVRSEAGTRLAAPVGSEIEAVRASDPLVTDTGPPVGSEIEAVRASVPLVTDAGPPVGSEIEAVRASDNAAGADVSAADTGFAMSLPDPATSAVIVGGIALLITGAAFVTRTGRRPRIS
jgi:hypothetical protein